ncbi:MULTISPECIES: osmotically-inducible lipoprotein OsmB [Dickeya]|uniref:Osmotically-inducible lipoprotein OsmB n=2 Tax=Dickeya TaxID=204037 RepID=A0AAE7CYN8_9GAMM|nr:MULTISPECIES: osmotically-inducible lipoprotein OsmB [Dickeya]ACZ76555.1 lipoprotein [Dickeya parazeae Ech586]MBP2836058.1 osmotically-inducible lipoprotein OsmB [Dickeya parazeae]MCO7261422.1 osmotically-inducible lipoprotein OsmB [Dickeya zeae]QIZ50873.1 osmotically-inducible lipoprotein OsmB [Dickeya zeae]QYM90668.1 osmotically-inducible lipoprotein OsmB [Dickeya zeae]
MQINKKFTTAVLAMVIVSTLAGCAGMNKRQRNTAIGAGIGAVGGAVLTNGSALGTVGGAAVGGIIGHQTTR